MLSVYQCMSSHAFCQSQVNPFTALKSNPKCQFKGLRVIASSAMACTVSDVPVRVLPAHAANTTVCSWVKIHEDFITIVTNLYTVHLIGHPALGS